MIFLVIEKYRYRKVIMYNHNLQCHTLEAGFPVESDFSQGFSSKTQLTLDTKTSCNVIGLSCTEKQMTVNPEVLVSWLTTSGVTPETLQFSCVPTHLNWNI